MFRVNLVTTFHFVYVALIQHLFRVFIRQTMQDFIEYFFIVEQTNALQKKEMENDVNRSQMHVCVTKSKMSAISCNISLLFYCFPIQSIMIHDCIVETLHFLADLFLHFVGAYEILLSCLLLILDHVQIDGKLK